MNADRAVETRVSVWAGWHAGSAASWNFCSFRTASVRSNGLFSSRYHNRLTFDGVRLHSDSSAIRAVTERKTCIFYFFPGPYFLRWGSGRENTKSVCRKQVIQTLFDIFF